MLTRNKTLQRGTEGGGPANLNFLKLVTFLTKTDIQGIVGLVDYKTKPKKKECLLIHQIECNSKFYLETFIISDGTY